MSEYKFNVDKSGNVSIKVMRNRKDTVALKLYYKTYKPDYTQTITKELSYRVVLDLIYREGVEYSLSIYNNENIKIPVRLTRMFFKMGVRSSYYMHKIWF